MRMDKIQIQSENMWSGCLAAMRRTRRIFFANQFRGQTITLRQAAESYEVELGAFLGMPPVKIATIHRDLESLHPSKKGCHGDEAIFMDNKYEISKDGFFYESGHRKVLIPRLNIGSPKEDPDFSLEFDHLVKENDELRDALHRALNILNLVKA